MSSATQSHEISDIETSEQGYPLSAEVEVAGPQPQVARPARAVRVSTPFALSLVKQLEEIKTATHRKNPITEDEAAYILVSMQKTTKNADNNTSGLRAPSTSSASTEYSDACPLTDGEEPIKCTSSRKEVRRPKKSRVVVSRRSSSTSAIFVTKTRIATRTKRVTAYNMFRTNASKVLGQETIKKCRVGGSFNGNISILWKEVSEEDKAAFSDWTAKEEKKYLIKLAKPQVEEKEKVSAAKEKGSRAATRVQPKRGVEGKVKK